MADVCNKYGNVYSFIKPGMIWLKNSGVAPSALDPHAVGFRYFPAGMRIPEAEVGCGLLSGVKTVVEDSRRG